MGILQRLFRKTPKEGPASSTPQLTQLRGDVDLAIVGESFCQDALWLICGARRFDPVRTPIVAVLVPEPENPYDSNAIRVDVNGCQVGHLSRGDAIRYGEGLRRLMHQHGGHIALNGVVVGGGPGRPHLGVWLQHDPRDFGVTPPDTSTRSPGLGARTPSMRTGFSEAWISDADDTSYDLSWHMELPDDDDAAIAKLRLLLPEDPDPIDRHYMFLELEERLYRLGLRDAAVMSDFDVVASAHHDEMDRIRAALIAKWETLPHLTTYRQMCIRRSKEKDWESCRSWAERGIVVYGDKAARGEWVADLVTRRDRAVLKLEQAARPPASRKALQGLATAQSEPRLSTETLTCQACGAAFERLRSRGRKPLKCPPCRG